MDYTLDLNINFIELSTSEYFDTFGGINWWSVAKSAVIGAGIGAVSMGIAGSGCGTVVLPIVGTVTVGAVCAVGGAIGGATKSIIGQIW
ncbi:hypothetical protein [Clostridium thermarum]|uniref:hypothetical protein n=1 Tax=Clostridium thermarum TaxID=1716543 RepID=UPI00111F42C1|nr:hypothetical protein [Clostridium thermarum]